MMDARKWPDFGAMSLDQADSIVKHQTVTRDAFLGGRLIVSQPRNGFRAGLDSVLLGASVPAGAATLLDLGSGVGTASLVALSDHPTLDATLVEIDPATIPLTVQNIAENGFAPRARVITADVAGKGAVREAAGIARDRYDVVIANPPFFDGERGTLPGVAARAGARHMGDDQLDLWVKTAAASAAPEGTVIFIHAATALPALLAAFDQRFGGVTVLPLLPRPGAPALRVLIRGRKGSRAPFTLLAPRLLHAAEGRAFTPEMDAVFRGVARFDW
jgi:tRNA1(Val) A37 N6-methylase TrmN6